MQRIPEPELMLEDDQAAAYAQADFEAPHRRFIELFRQTFPDWPGNGHVLDLGCGPGDISMRFARAYPRCMVDGIDGAPAMLEAGRVLLASDPDCAGRVHLHQACLPDDRAPRDRYDVIISNSLLHHLHDPAIIWNAICQYAQAGALVFVVDLKRPASREQARGLTDQYAAGEPEVLQRDFFNSLLASFTVDEVRQQLDRAGLPHLNVAAISDRHLMIHGVR